MSTATPAYRKRILGELLKEYRDNAGLSREEVADELGSDVSKVQRIEAGKVGVSKSDLGVLIRIYDITDLEKQDELRGWAAGSSAVETWMPPGTGSTARSYYQLERVASAIRDYQISLVPGLCQTAEFATAVLSPIYPDQPGKVDEAVNFRRTRAQSVLYDKRVEYQVVIRELAVLTNVGSPSVMHAQIMHLVSLMDMPHVSIQLITNELGHPDRGSTSFSVLEFNDTKLTPLVRLSSVLGMHYIDRPLNKVQAHIDQMKYLRGFALGHEATRERLIRIATDWIR